MIDVLLPHQMDLTVPLKPSKVWFIEGTRTFVNGYTKDVSTNKIKINGIERGIYCEIFPPKDGRFPTTVLYEDVL